MAIDSAKELKVRGRADTERNAMVYNARDRCGGTKRGGDIVLTPTRREMLKALGMGAVACASASRETSGAEKAKKTHFVTLSFDDGFKKSSLRTAEIYEKYGLKACINVIATAHLPGFVLPNEYHRWPVGDFGLWNELQSRGHEIMPHGFKHANKREAPLDEAKDLIRRCLDYFSRELKGFESRKAVFNFPFNASTLAVEEWLSDQVMAFRTGGPAINSLPGGQKKLTCTSHGPDGIDEHLTREVEELLAHPSGWLIYNTHGLDEEGWGPLGTRTLETLLERLVATPSVAVVPAGHALVSAKTPQ